MSIIANSFRAELHRRIALNEGCVLRAYQDTRGIWTIGVGFNLERDDAHHVLGLCGIAIPDGWSHLTITQTECDALLAFDLGSLEDRARASLAPGVYNRLCDARRFVICDLIFNLGAAGWAEFANTRALIAAGAFSTAASHLQGSDWYRQVGARAVRNVAMMRSGVWVPQ